MADRLERVNQTLLSENNKLKGQFISQEEDRNFLIKQLVTVKKENAKLRSEFTETEKELVELENKLRVLEAEKASGWGSGGGGASNRPGVLGGNLASTLRDSDTEERYKDVNIRCIASHIYLTFIHSFIHYRRLMLTLSLFITMMPIVFACLVTLHLQASTLACRRAKEPAAGAAELRAGAENPYRD